MPLTFLCAAALAIDGDTLKCRNVEGAGGRVRLAAIDAPELPGHCRQGRHCAPGDPFKARDLLARLVRKGPVRCTVVDASPAWPGFQDHDRYGRRVARCEADGVDLSDAMLQSGLAVRWPHG